MLNALKFFRFVFSLHPDFPLTTKTYQVKFYIVVMSLAVKG